MSLLYQIRKQRIAFSTPLEKHFNSFKWSPAVSPAIATTGETHIHCDTVSKTSLPLIDTLGLTQSVHKPSY